MQYAAPQAFRPLAGVYIIRCATSEKVYVGSTNNLWRRFREHRAALNRQEHRSPPLQRAATKHGVASLRFEVLLTCLPAQLLPLEQRMMDLFQAAHSDYGYNCSLASGSCAGIRRTDEQRAKMSAAQKAAMTPERRAKIAAGMRCGVRLPVTAETIEKIRLGNLGKFVSAETRALMSAARTGKKNSPETIAKRKASCAATKAAKAALLRP